MTLEESLKALKAAFTSKSGEAQAMSKEMESIKASNASLKDQLKAASAFMDAAKVVESQRDEAIAKIEELTKTLAASESTKVEAVKQIETAGKKAASIAASVGVTPVEISAADNATSKSPEEIWSEYLAIKNPAEKLAFYNKNRASIVAHLGVK
jgi:chromosome segregation ATPase